MHEMKAPAMCQAMRKVGGKMMREIKEVGYSIAIMAGMDAEGSIEDPYRFDVDECLTVERFMVSAKQRICKRVRNGDTVVLVGVTVLLHKKFADEQKGGNLEDAKRRLLESGIDTVPGAAVFAVNRQEFASELYTCNEEEADKLRDLSSEFVKRLRIMSDYLFEGIPWPRMN